MRFLVLLALIIIFSCTESENDNLYTIAGKIVVSEGDEVILSVYNPITQEIFPVDTAAIGEDGKFQLDYEWERPDLYRLDLPGSNYLMLAIDEGQDEIHLTFGPENRVDITGSEDSEKLLKYERFRKRSNERWVKPAYAAMREASANEDQRGEIEAVRTYVFNNNKHRRELIDFAEDSIGNSIALYGTSLRWTGDEDVERLDNLVTAFEEAHPDLEMSRKMREKVERFKKVAIWATAPDLAAQNVDGEEVKLQSLLGEVTLLDFWASWCGPCLLQIPDLKSAYEKYHDNGFEIIGISVDSKEDKWKAAIEKYGMEWPQLSDVKGWQSDLASKYNVTYIPFNFLLDEEGTIIAKNLHSASLHETLAELLK